MRIKLMRDEQLTAGDRYMGTRNKKAIVKLKNIAVVYYI